MCVGRKIWRLWWRRCIWSACGFSMISQRTVIELVRLWLAGMLLTQICCSDSDSVLIIIGLFTRLSAIRLWTGSQKWAVCSRLFLVFSPCLVFNFQKFCYSAVSLTVYSSYAKILPQRKSRLPGVALITQNVSKKCSRQAPKKLSTAFALMSKQTFSFRCKKASQNKKKIKNLRLWSRIWKVNLWASRPLTAS